MREKERRADGDKPRKGEPHELPRGGGIAHAAEGGEKGHEITEGRTAKDDPAEIYQNEGEKDGGDAVDGERSPFFRREVKRRRSGASRSSKICKRPWSAPQRR